MAEIRLWTTAIVQCFAGGSTHYFFGFLNPLEPFVKNFLDESMNFEGPVTDSMKSFVWASIQTAHPVGTVAGAFAIDYPVKRYGGRFTINIIKNLSQIAACLLMFLAVSPFNSWILLIVGRFLGGFSMGVSLYIPIFLAECSPTRYRGTISTISILGEPIWTAFGTFMGLPTIFGSQELWKYSALVPLVPSVLHYMFTLWIPMSPKFLFINKMDRVRSTKSLQFYYGKEANFEQIFETFKREDLEGRGSALNSRGKVTLWGVMKVRKFRIPFLICIVSSVMMFAGGIDIIDQYSTGLFHSLGIPTETSAYITVFLIQAPTVLTTLACISLIDRWGRRPLILTGYGMGIIAVGLIFLAGIVPNSNLEIIFGILGAALSITSYYFGPMPVSYILPGELVPHSINPLVSSISFGLTFVAATVITFAYPPLQLMYGSLVFLPLCVLGILSFLFLYFYLPETKGRDVDDIVREFDNRKKVHYENSDDLLCDHEYSNNGSQAYGAFDNEAMLF